MKLEAKRYFQIIVFVFASLCAAAQKDSRTKLGVKAGYSISDVKGNEAELYEMGSVKHKKGTGFTFGLVLQQPFKNELLSFKAELNYIKKGGTFGNSDAWDKTVDYLQLPVMMSYDLISKTVVSFSVEGGVAFNYAIKPVQYNKELYLNPGSIKTPTFMLSPVAGATLRYKQGKTEPFVSLRYDFDFGTYFTRYASKDYNLKHAGTLAFNAGVLFKL